MIKVDEAAEANCNRLAAQLLDSNWAVQENFIQAGRVAELALEAHALHDQGAFRHSAIGRTPHRDSAIRSDLTLWFDPNRMPQARKFLGDELETLRRAINAATFLGLYEFEAHYAVYPPGAFYARHVDRFQDGGHREVSVVLYLNDTWDSEDGGELCLYPESGAAVKIPPRGGTLVVFLSRLIPHEVLTSHTLRFSLTGWFRRREGSTPMRAF